MPQIAATANSIRWFAETTHDDIPSVDGKNASLGEMVRELGSVLIRVPDGFAVTAAAYRDFLASAARLPRARSLYVRNPRPSGKKSPGP